MRKRQAEKREVLADPIYNSKMITKLINRIMIDGKKGTAQNILYEAFDIIKKKTGEDPMTVFEKAYENIKPSLEIRSRRVGGSNYQVPTEVRADRQQALAFRWLIQYAKNSIVIVMGCYAQNLYNSNKINEIEDYADIIIGNYGKSKLLEYISIYKNTNEKIIDFHNMKDIPFEDMEIKQTHNHTRGFIKIEDGCDNYCNYCIIPYVRGSVRSKSKDNILNEVNSLLNSGTKEIVLTGIHTGYYNDKNYNLFNLFLDLIEIPINYRIRLSSIEIVELSDEIIALLNEEKIANHLHIPLQSGSDKILKDMNRRYDTHYFEEKIKKIRNINPLISISTDVIVGYPKESEKDFIDTYNFCKKMKFSKIHVFPYSDREGTVSSSSSLKVKEDIKKERVRKLLELSNILKDEYEKMFEGKKLDILIENEKDGYFYGHTSNYIYLKLKGDYKVNGFYNVKILNNKENNDIILI